MADENVEPAPKPRAPVIRLDNFGEGSGQRILKRQMPAWVISVGIHVVLLGLFLVFNLMFGSRAAKQAAAQDTTIETKVEDEEKDKNFDNTDVGVDANLPTNYNIERIEDVSVAGPVKPDEAPGNNGPNDTPMNLPPPPGIGATDGQGGGIDLANVTGAGALGNSGGMGGPVMAGAGFKGRSGATRQKMLQEGGGNTVTEACVAKGLTWLAKVQKPSGAWEIDGAHKSTIAGTGLALLPFLAAGQTHKTTGSKDAATGGKYTKNVENGLKYLTAQQKGDGSFAPSQNMYDQAIATMALCEAYGMTADPKLKAPAQLAVGYIVKAQHSGGSWGYTAGTEGDTSVSGWQVQALKSALLAGLSVPKDVAVKASTFLDRVSGGQGAAKGSLYGYRDAGGTPSMTAVGLLCRQYLGWGPKNPKLAGGIEFLKQLPPRKDSTDAKSLDMYYYYYATQVVHFFGGPDWHENWNPKMSKWLTETQVQGGRNDGSWNPDGAHADAGGRLVMTTMALLTLEVYYRHLPLYKRDAGAMQALEGS